MYSEDFLFSVNKTSLSAVSTMVIQAMPSVNIDYQRLHFVKRYISGAVLALLMHIVVEYC